MAKKSILIIGAGLAGLSAGCYAEMNGYRSHIFEHHSSPGGVVATWKRKDYIFDGGVHFWTGPLSSQSSYVVYDELGIKKMNRFLPLSRYCDFIEEASGAVLSVTSDMDRLASDFQAISVRD